MTLLYFCEKCNCIKGTNKIQFICDKCNSELRSVNESDDLDIFIKEKDYYAKSKNTQKYL